MATTEPARPLPPSADAGPAPSAAVPRRSRTRRVLRGLGWSLLGLVVLVVAIGAGAWWWLGSNESLAFALARAARYMPEGQTLQSREVSGSLRAGGRIGWLRYESPTLAVEVQDATIGWQLPPLLDRKVKLGEVHAARVLVERRGPVEEKPEPLKPLEPIVLPVEVELPFRIDDLRWSGPPALQATALAGSYRYQDQHHKLDIDNVEIADGRYSAKLDLEGPAPMAIQAHLEGRVRTPLPEDRSIEVLARADVGGKLAGSDARLKVDAALEPVESDAASPMAAQLRATLAPWQPQPVLEAHADLSNLDVARLWPKAPQTLLSGSIDVGPQAGGAADAPTVWQIATDIRNAAPGPYDTGKLPLERIEAAARYDGSAWTLLDSTIRAGGGRIDAEGSWAPAPEPWRATATLRNVRPGELHTALAGGPIGGSLKAEQRADGIVFDLALQAGGGAGAKALAGLRLDSAEAHGRWNDQVLDLRMLQVKAANATLDGQQLQLRIAEEAASGEIRLAIPGGSARIRGRAAPASGGGEITAAIDDAAGLQRWIESLPGLERTFAGASAKGSARLDAKWQGGWRAIQRRLKLDAPVGPGAAEPTLQATLTAPRLDLRLPAAAAAGANANANAAATPSAKDTEIQLRGLRAELAGSLPRMTLALDAEASTGNQKLNLDLKGSGGLERAGVWRAALDQLRLRAQDLTRPGPWTVELTQPFSSTIRQAPDRLEMEATAGGASLRGPVPGVVRLDWQPLRFSQSGGSANRSFRLQSKGRMQGLPLAWAEAFGGGAAMGEVGISGDLKFDGDWDIDAADALRATARLVRQSGDIRVQAGEVALVTRITSRGTGTASERTMNAAADGPSTPAGLREAELRLDAVGESVKASLSWKSERAGEIRADIATRVQRQADGWQWGADAPLEGRVRASLPNLGVWSILAPPGWRIAGTLQADAAISGSRSAPRWNGSLNADQLAIRALVEGLDLRDGRLRARLSGDRVQITEFSLKGGAGSSTRIAGQSGNVSTGASEAASDGGTLSATGELSWGTATPTATGIRMAMQAELRRLRVLVRSDRQISLSGGLQARLESGQFTVRGDLKTDRAVIILPEESAPSLGTDVVVRSAAKDREAAEAAKRQVARDEAQVAKAQTAKPPDILVGFDLGNDFAVQGRGITTRLEGKLDIRTSALGAPPRITGEVRTVKGQYRAYGQALNVETGLARFNGPYDNPSLDILAIRPNISQRAGVQISGTAQSPRVKLYSEPALSDAETLSWVVLGRASASSGGESLLLQQAALAVLGGLGKGGSSGGLASRFGLDEIGFKGPGNGGDLRGSALTVGKRISKDFYLTYERSLAGTLGTIFIFYDLTRRLTLRGQAGQQSGLDLIYTLQYDGAGW
ncbi:Autotransporter secretion inner membrane protein TamB [Burkholderiales bacterium 8X]|nr:Autotransporter secretion inner membrane protein TamB [Burkholderiales bacterium 8X]